MGNFYLCPIEFPAHLNHSQYVAIDKIAYTCWVLKLTENDYSNAQYELYAIVGIDGVVRHQKKYEN